MHSVSEVRAAFARHGLSLSIMERNRVSTMLQPTWYARALRRTPALGTPPRAPNYELFVVTDRARLRDLPHHLRRLSYVTIRRDNVFVVFFRGTAGRERLEGILDDI
jgi:hypothetical protein